MRELARVNFDTTLAAAEWHVGDSEFESHQRCKGFNLLKINMVRVSGAALARELMGRVLGSVAGDSLELAVVSA